MVTQIDKKYRQEEYGFDALNSMKKHCSLPHIFLGKLILSIRTIILFCIGCLIVPFFPKGRYGIIPLPSSISNYFMTLLKIYFLLIGLFVFVLLLASLIEYIRTKIDIHYGYKNVGSFAVTKIFNRGFFKSIKLNNRDQIKIANSDRNFVTIKVGQVIEIERTATYRFLNYKILTE